MEKKVGGGQFFKHKHLNTFSEKIFFFPCKTNIYLCLLLGQKQNSQHPLLFSHDQCWPAVLHRGDPHVGGHLRRGHHHGAGPGHHAHHRQHHEAENHCQDGLSESGARHANQELPGENLRA